MITLWIMVIQAFVCLAYQDKHLIHTPVLVGHFNNKAADIIFNRNRDSIPAMTVTLDFNAEAALKSRSEESSMMKRATSCDFDSECSGSSCCTNVVGRTQGQCFDQSATKCCVDGSILPASIAQNLTGADCCSYSSSSNTYTSCSTSAFPKCGVSGSCVSSCNQDTECSAGSSCCLAPAYGSTAGHRCYSSSEVCCFDGRVCTSSICNIPNGGQCCGVNAATNSYSFCNGSSYCNIVNGKSQCTSVAYGQPSDGSDAFPLGYNSPGDGSSTNLGLILGIAIPVGLVVIGVIAAVLFVVMKRRRRNRSDGKIVEPTVPPRYNASATGMPSPNTYHKLAASASAAPMSSMGSVPPSYTLADNATYAPMEAVPNGQLRGHDTAIDWSEIEVFNSIGRGSFGEAYKAKWHEAVVAVKKIHPDLLNNAEAINNFYLEIEILKNLKPHPNTVLFFGVTKEPIAIIMEFCENGSLHQFLHSPIAISLAMKRNFLLGIARGMLHLHFYNVIHRDLAARNILLTSNLDVKVSDFGFSRELEGPNGGRIKTPVGPVNWFPPEALSDHTFSMKTDIWSFGVVVWEVLTRREPFDDKTTAEVLYGVTHTQMTVTIPDDCPPLFASIMRLCFQQNPSERPTFKEICNMLESEPTQETVTA